MKIAFSDNYLGERGTAVALYDFAHYNETILGNTSIILMPKSHPAQVETVVNKFKNRFEVFEHDFKNINQVDAILLEQKADAFYTVGNNDFHNIVIPNLSHMVFLCNPSHYNCRSQDRIAFISDYLSNLAKAQFNANIPSIPWMIDIPNVSADMRETLEIPSDALVLGYHGGEDCFGIPWVAGPIKQALDYRPDLYILLVNVKKELTSIDFNHPRLMFLPKIVDMEQKAKFIKTCDAMLHARQHGETFGLSCGEFSVLNRPVIACTQVPDRCHIEVLGDKLLAYSNPEELYNILMNINHGFIASHNWDKYSATFSPHAAMQKFKEVFLDTL
jgi:hypothetical protein